MVNVSSAKSTDKPSGAGTASVYLVAGDDEFAVSSAGREIASRLVPPGDEAFGLEIVEAGAETVEQAITAVRRCCEALWTGGFLGAGKVVWLRGASFLAGSVTGRSADVKAALEALTEIIKQGLPPGQVLVVTTPQVDERTSFFLACKKAGADIRSLKLPDKSWEADEHAGRYAAEAMKKAGLSLPADAMDAFIRKVGTDPRQISNEVEKLSLYLGARRTVRMDDIDVIVSATRELPAWDLAEAVGNRDLVGALRILGQLLFQGEQPVGLVASLERHIGNLVVLHEAMDRGWLRVSGGGRISASWQASPAVDEALSVLGKDDPRKMHPFRCAKLASQARKFSLPELCGWRALAVRTHEQLVSSSVSDSLLLETLLVRMIGKTGSRAGTVGRGFAAP